MDNCKILVQSEGRRAFDWAFQLVFDKTPTGKATHYLEDTEKGFILFWHEPALSVKASKLPYAAGWKESADLVWGWLSERTDKEYREYLDHDGSNGHGFRVYNDAWSKIDGMSYSFWQSFQSGRGMVSN